MGSVAEYYEGKNIFITGGSGFLGKVVIEKILRSCPGVGDLYVLLRSKKGKGIEERMLDIKEKAIFDVLRKSDPAALDKLIPISGDATKLGLGMSEEDRQLIINNVHIIFHTAASVRFDDSLKYALILNTRGTRETVQLAMDVKNLSVFVHISTTFCNTDRTVIEEKIYPPHADWRDSIEIAETVEDDVLNAMATKYIDPLPNTYTFAKSLSEHTVNDMCKGKIPAIIIRPSVGTGILFVTYLLSTIHRKFIRNTSTVVSTMKDPFPGWNDNFNGPIGLLVAGAKGLLRTVLGHRNVIQDFIPADMVVRLMIIAAQEKAVNGNKDDIEVYHSSKGELIPVSVGEIVDMGPDIIEDSPFSQMLWSPNFSMTSCWYNYYIQVILFHMIPAIFIDFLLMLAGKKTMLVKVQRKIYIANVVLEYFLKHTWKFENIRTFALIDRLSDEDKKIFGLYGMLLEMRRAEIIEYFRNGTIGAALYILKDDFDFTRVESRKKLYRLRILDRIIKTIFFGIVLWFFTLKYNVFKYICNGMENYIRSL